MTQLLTPPPMDTQLQAETAPYLSLRGVRKRFGQFEALKGIDLDIPPSSFVCFLGPSGCGKSTLLRAIAGLDRQDAGSIHQAGRDISHLPPGERDFGIVFQSYALFPNLTVAENIGYGLVNRQVPKAERQRIVDELLSVVGLPGSGGKFPNQLSGGQQQRVALARALAMEPGLLLLDEPLSALDARVRLRLRAEIRDLQRRLGITTIMVTHDQDEALTMADLIVVMSDGKIEQIGSPQAIYRRPASLFVADFVGSMTAVRGMVFEPGAVVCGRQVLHVPTGALRGPVQLRLRPEALALCAGGDQPNRLTGTVAAVTFHGPGVQVEIDCGLDHDVPLRLDLGHHALAGCDLGPGAAIAVTVPPDAVHLFAEPTA